MRTKRTSKSLIDEAVALKKKIDSGKIKGAKALKSAKYKYGNLMYRGRKRLKDYAKNLDKNQAFLPSFISQQELVRIEEMMIERLHSELKQKGIIIQKAKNKHRKAS